MTLTGTGSISNTATVSSPNDINPANNSATAAATVIAPGQVPLLDPSALALLAALLAFLGVAMTRK